MNFTEIALYRQSCRNYDPTRPVEVNKLTAILEAARLAPSACNGQSYHFTVFKGAKAQEAARACMSRGMNKFADKAPVMIAISEAPYPATAALGAKITGNDYRSMDIGIAAAYLTAEAAAQELGTCILGWFDEGKLRELAGVKYPVRLVIALGYPAPNDTLRTKKRKALDALVTEIE